MSCIQLSRHNEHVRQWLQLVIAWDYCSLHTFSQRENFWERSCEPNAVVGRESNLFTPSMEVIALFCLRCITDDQFTKIYLFILLEQWRNTRWEADECFRWGLSPNQTYPLGILTLVSVAYIHNAAAPEMRPQLRRNGKLIMG